jgi:leucyl-tRNA synthetase
MEHANSTPPPNGFGNAKAPMRIEDLKTFLKLLAPFAPHITEELWFELQKVQSRRGHKVKKSDRLKFKSIHLELWPEFDPKLIEEETFTLIIQVNGKVRDQVEAKKGISQKEAEDLTFSREKIKLALANQKPKKVIFVPNRLINIVI